MLWEENKLDNNHLLVVFAKTISISPPEDRQRSINSIAFGAICQSQNSHAYQIAVSWVSWYVNHTMATAPKFERIL